MHLDQPIREHDIAIIAMAGRFPGASGVAAFWQNLADGVESFTRFTDDELRESGVDDALIEHPDYVKVRPVLDNISGFDARFFGYSPREAEVADPQQRIFMECVWEVLETAGYGKPSERGRVGLFAGANLSMYMARNLIGPKGMATIDPYEVMIGNDKDALATVIAHRLDLTGPALSVQTFCSTSAVAMHLACQSLRRGESEIALAGGVCVRVPDRVGHLYFPGGMESPDGHIRTFDEQARGGIFGDGAGVVALKPLRAAVADRDTVLAVIRGSAINNDGAAKFSYTAPSVVGQSSAVTAALLDAEVSPRDVSYVEAHGTATELGDPIEVAALTQAFRAAEKELSGSELTDREYCAIGSVKTNVGHLDRAATVAGLIKVVEALRNQEIPRSLNFEKPNPEIEFARSPFYVAKDPVPWQQQRDQPRIAGVNGLGMGGTNVHLVLQEAPAPVGRPADPRRWHLLPLSAQHENAAREQREQLAAHLVENPEVEPGDVGFTLHQGRTLFAHRQVCVTDSVKDAAVALAGEQTESAAVTSRHEITRGRSVAFLFGGVGEHYPGMVAELYRTEPVFRAHLDAGQRLLTEFCGRDVVGPLTSERPAAVTDLAALMGREENTGTAGPLSDTALAQPAVFLAEYAIAATLAEWGLRPAMVLGYSVGELVAACLAGVMSLADAVKLVAHRAGLIAECPPGAMLAVGLAWEELSARIPGLAERELDLGAITPGQSVVSGPVDAVAALATELRAQDVVCRELDTTHAFHSRMLRPRADELTAWVTENITLTAPTLPYVSNVTGQEITAELATDPGYWARHMCEPVQFEDGLAEVLDNSDMVLLEIGAGRSLGAMARSHQDCDRDQWPLIVATLPAAHEPKGDDRAFAEALGELWMSGAELDWNAYYRARRTFTPGRIPLPTYPFQRQEYWYDPGWSAPAHPGSGGDFDLNELPSEYQQLPLLPESQWIHLPLWQQRLPQPPLPAVEGERWLVFTDTGQAGDIVEALRERTAHQLTLLRPAGEFTEDGDGFGVRPGNIRDLQRVFQALRQRGELPQRVLHLWNLDSCPASDAVARGTHTLIALAGATHEVSLETWTLDVVTAGVQQVLGTETIYPERATVLGPCTIIPVECPGATLRNIDILTNEPAPVDQLLAELATAPGNQTVALRGGRVWTPDYHVLEETTEQQEARTPLAAIRQGGVYLITGGLGGIGLALATRLATDYQAKLVLLGRTPVPPPEQWDSVLADPSATDEVRRRIEGLRELEAAGGEFRVVRGDVAKEDDVRRAVAAAREEFGELHGVLHCAGVPGVGLMQFKTTEVIDRVLAPKVAGTLALAAALEDVPVDFLALFSSVASVTGALGQADYSAANIFLDAFAASGRLAHTRVVAVGWGEWQWNGWQEGLEGYEPVLRKFYEAHREHYGIHFDQGWRLLQQVLARPEPHLFVSTQDFAEMARGSRNYTIEDVQQGARYGRGEHRYPRPELSTPYVPARDHTETTIAGIWADALGVENVGINDNFFDLGGNSMIGVGIIAAIRRELSLDHLPAHVLYQASTVAALAGVINPSSENPEDGSGDAPGGTGDRARQRQQRLARRRATQREGGSDD